MQSIVIDIWGGERSQDHVARFFRSVEEAMNIARDELSAGFLVNLRTEAAWGPNEEFDSRRKCLQ